MRKSTYERAFKQDKKYRYNSLFKSAGVRMGYKVHANAYLSKKNCMEKCMREGIHRRGARNELEQNMSVNLII